MKVLRLSDEKFFPFAVHWLEGFKSNKPIKESFIFYGCLDFNLMAQCRSQTKYQETNYQRLQMEKVDVSQLFPGGIIILDPDAFLILGNFSTEKETQQFLQQCANTVIKNFKKKGIKAELSSTNDILINQEKISGFGISELNGRYCGGFMLNATVNNKQISQVSHYNNRMATGYKAFNITKEEVLSWFDYLKPIYDEQSLLNLFK